MAFILRIGEVFPRSRCLKTVFLQTLGIAFKTEGPRVYAGPKAVGIPKFISRRPCRRFILHGKAFVFCLNMAKSHASVPNACLGILFFSLHTGYTFTG